MNIQYHCDVCKTGYDKQEDAVACEQAHVKIDAIKIRGIGFKNTQGLYAADKFMYQWVPASVILQFSNQPGDIAKYTLERIGMKGL
jgi:hypothetical protein